MMMMMMMMTVHVSRLCISLVCCVCYVSFATDSLLASRSDMQKKINKFVKRNICQMVNHFKIRPLLLTNEYLLKLQKEKFKIFVR